MPSFFFFNDTATTEIYTLSLHDALPILLAGRAKDVCEPGWSDGHARSPAARAPVSRARGRDRAAGGGGPARPAGELIPPHGGPRCRSLSRPRGLWGGRGLPQAAPPTPRP